MIRGARILLLGVVMALGLGFVWFTSQPPDEVDGWLTQAHPPTPTSAPAQPTPAPPPPPPDAPAQPMPAPPSAPAPRACRALTWGVRGQTLNAVWVGSLDGVSDPYHGDTPCSETRALLCFKPGARPQPAGFSLPPPINWSGGQVALLEGVMGLEVRSRAEANRWCATRFGVDWRMAEFHDAGGWGYAAEGEIPREVRFWVAINDQRANLWDR